MYAVRAYSREFVPTFVSTNQVLSRPVARITEGNLYPSVQSEMARQLEEADLMSLGDHCEVEECKQIDFLPFKCDACEKVRPSLPAAEDPLPPNCRNIRLGN